MRVAGGKQAMQKLKHVLPLPQPGKGQDIEDFDRLAEAQGWEEEKWTSKAQRPAENMTG